MVGECSMYGEWRNSSVVLSGDTKDQVVTALGGLSRADVDWLLAEVDKARAEHAELLAELGSRDGEARERWVQQQMAEIGIRSTEFRAGTWSMDLEPAREMAAMYTAMAKALLGDAPNYTETKLMFDTKIAESPETYTLVVQRHAPGALTPHEARQRAETEVDRLQADLSRAQEDAKIHGANADAAENELAAVAEALGLSVEHSMEDIFDEIQRLRSAEVPPLELPDQITAVYVEPGTPDPEEPDETLPAGWQVTGHDADAVEFVVRLGDIYAYSTGDLITREVAELIASVLTGASRRWARENTPLPGGR